MGAGERNLHARGPAAERGRLQRRHLTMGVGGAAELP